MNLTQPKLTENNTYGLINNITQTNKKLFKVLGPSKKKKETK